MLEYFCRKYYTPTACPASLMVWAQAVGYNTYRAWMAGKPERVVIQLLVQAYICQFVKLLALVLWIKFSDRWDGPTVLFKLWQMASS